jgi:hypothetical protein
VNPERWQQIENIFQQAADLPPEEQNQFLDQACGTDSELYQKSLKVWDDWPKQSVSSPFNVK